MENEFRFFKYMHKIIENRGIIRVPLTCLCEYGGLMAFFKAKAFYYEQNSYQDDLEPLDR